MQRKIVCLYSGGIKSVAYLAKILTDKQYDDYIIQVHYINIINHTREFQSAVEAVNKSLKFFQEASHRKFVVTENQVNFSCLPAPSPLPLDIDICVFVASQMINVDPSIRFVVMGFSKDDLANSDMFAQMQAYLEMTKQNPDASLDAEYLFPLIDNSYDEILAMQPKGLFGRG